MAKKVCTSCGDEKVLSEFHKDKSCWDGYRPRCKVCRSSEAKVRYVANRERHLSRNREYYEENRDRCLERSRKYYKKTLGYQRKRRSEYHLNNPQVAQEHSAKRRAALSKDVGADRELIKEIYLAAKCAQMYTGVPVEVDHILPISKGGTHHEDNLQLLYRTDNRKKGAKIG